MLVITMIPSSFTLEETDFVFQSMERTFGCPQTRNYIFDLETRPA